MPAAFIALLILTTFAWCGSLVFFIAWRAVRPPRMNDGKALYVLKRLSPEDLGLAFSDMPFAVRDERGRTLRIVAWWMPTATASPHTAILLHGYAGAKISAIAWAPLWHGLGWNVLAIDQRAHGDSGGAFCTGGYFERDDLDQIIDQLRAAEPVKARQIALFGVSLGTGAAVGVAARRDDIEAVVLDSPFADYRNAIRSHMRRRHMPLAFLHGAMVAFAGRLCGARWADARLVDQLRRVHCPVLLIRGADDDFVTPADLAALEAALHGRAGTLLSRQIVVGGAHHTLAFMADPPRYRDALSHFLTDATVDAPPGNSPEV